MGEEGQEREERIEVSVLLQRHKGIQITSSKISKSSKETQLKSCELQTYRPLMRNKNTFCNMES